MGVGLRMCVGVELEGGGRSYAGGKVGLGCRLGCGVGMG